MRLARETGVTACGLPCASGERVATPHAPRVAWGRRRELHPGPQTVSATAWG